MVLLQTKALKKRFGGVTAIQKVDIAIEQGEIVGLIGPNGAGKSTFFATITGYLKADGGSVFFNNEKISGLRPDQIARKGMARTFQIVRPIQDMTVLDNVLVGSLMHTSNVTEARKIAQNVLDFIGMGGKINREIRELTLADKKRLEVARALATQPKLILLDEVMAGLTASESHEAVELIRHINHEFGITLIIVEHVMEVVMPLSHRVVVLDHGAKIAEGPPEKIASNSDVIKAYLGSTRQQKKEIYYECNIERK